MKIENNLAVDEEGFSAIEEHYGCTLDAGLTTAQVEPATLLPVFGVAGGGLLIYIAEGS